jgi:hypothetical protein
MKNLSHFPKTDIRFWQSAVFRHAVAQPSTVMRLVLTLKTASRNEPTVISEVCVGDVADLQGN